MRKPDRPGSWRVRPKDGRFRVSGVRPDGQRVHLWAKSEDEGNTLGRSIFGSSTHAGIGPIPSSQPQTQEVDEWGFPVKISPEVAASVAASFGIKPTPTTGGPTAQPSPSDAKLQEEKDKKLKRAKSLMELAGVGWAFGTVQVSKKFVDRSGREPVNVDKKQVNELADATRDTFVELFGDRDIKPWHLMLLLTFGIPASMWLQSPKKKTDESQNEPAKLKSVP